MIITFSFNPVWTHSAWEKMGFNAGYESGSRDEVTSMSVCD